MLLRAVGHPTDRLPRRAFAGLTISLLALTTAGCGVDEEPAKSLSTGEFCSAVTKLNETKGWKNKQKAGRKLQGLGVPEGLPKDARAGFELVLDKALTAKNDADLMRELNALSAADQARVSAMGTYVAQTCRAEATDPPTDESGG